jgi:apolipoprotein N-acyltransferase
VNDSQKGEETEAAGVPGRSSSRRVPLLVTLLAVLLSGAMWFASVGVHHVWPLAWLAPLPLLAVLPDLRPGRAALAACGGSALGALNLVLAYHGLPPVLLGVVVLLIAGPLTLVALAWRAIARRTHPALAMTAYPALVVSADYLRSLLSPHGTFGCLAYSQTDVLPVVQLASVTGMWGITFLVSLVPAALAVMWRGRRTRRVVWVGLGLATLPLALTLAFGTARLAAPSPGQEVRIGLAASDPSAVHFAAQDADEALPVIRAYADRAAALADRGAEVVVLPEKFVGITPAYADHARAVLAAVARERHLTIVAGFNCIGTPEPRNVAVVFGPDGEVALEYDKMYPVPGLEQGYRRGDAIGLVAGAPLPTGVAICKDLDFVPLGRAHARAGVGLLLVPAWDFENDGWLHSRMAMMRGVEGGYALARCATKGRLTVADARGQVLAERASSEAPEVLLVAGVPVGAGGTFYSRSGDWFAWLCLAAGLVSGAAAWKGRAAE